MFVFFLKRSLLMVPALLGAATLIFMLLALTPGDPARTILGPRANAESLERVRAELGLDRPLIERFAVFLKKTLRFDLGRSILTKQSVLKEIFLHLPATLELSFAALIWSTLCGVLLGVLAARYRNSIFDYSSMSLALVGVSMPVFWLALVLIIIFAVKLGWMPSGGRMNARFIFAPYTGFYLLDGFIIWLETGENRFFFSAMRHLFLPALTLGTIPLAMIARITRSSMLEHMQKPYIRTARSLGFSENKIIFHYALKNALLPVITVVGLQFGTLLSGAVLTETIFSWPGIGKWLYLAIDGRDYPVIQGGVLFISVLFLLINLGVDFICALVNPRIRHGDLT